MIHLPNRNSTGVAFGKLRDGGGEREGKNGKGKGEDSFKRSRHRRNFLAGDYLKASIIGGSKWRRGVFGGFIIGV